MSGTLFIVSAPSGAGKTTLVRGLLERDPTIQLSISYTTRAPRENEADGREYHFIDIERFHAMREAGEFLEWAEVHGNYYGTSFIWLAHQLEQGHDTLLEIDWQGAQQVQRLFPERVSIFVLPPSFAELEKRLRGRGTDKEEVIALRLQAARNEMRHAEEFAYAIINESLPTAINDLTAIVRAARLRCANQHIRYPHLFQFPEQD
jgi:guanylate kinase